MEIPVTFVILAAGLGTRMKSRKAKVLHRAGGKALLEHVVDAVLELADPHRTYVVVGHQSEEVRKLVGSAGIGFVHQTEQKGTGHALMVAAKDIKDHAGLLVILYGDCPLISAATLKQLIEAQTQSDAAGTILTAVMEDPTGYGRVVRDSSGNVLRLVEQRAGTPEQLAIRESNMGLYCYRSKPFFEHVNHLRPDNPAKEYYLTDMVEMLVGAGHRLETLTIADPREVLGINNRVELAAVDSLLRERKLRELMLAGVTIEKPETVTIDADVQIGMDSLVEPFARILGRTTIGENCRIGSASIILDSELADDVEVGAFTIIRTSRVEKGATVGPFARLRMDNFIGEGAHVGNFVELKKTSLGRGSKAQHLAYLGDSQIGTRVNVGAGTITCNYDGLGKHKTLIGDHAFIGSNATLVAPVEIGAGAYLGAGSVITDPVPPDALALGRARQVTKEEWARRRRERNTADTAGSPARR